MTGVKLKREPLGILPAWLISSCERRFEWSETYRGRSGVQRHPPPPRRSQLQEHLGYQKLPESDGHFPFELTSMWCACLSMYMVFRGIWQLLHKHHLYLGSFLSGSMLPQDDVDWLFNPPWHPELFTGNASVVPNVT